MYTRAYVYVCKCVCERARAKLYARSHARTRASADDRAHAVDFHRTASTGSAQSDQNCRDRRLFAANTQLVPLLLQSTHRQPRIRNRSVCRKLCVCVRAREVLCKTNYRSRGLRHLGCSGIHLTHIRTAYGCCRFGS